MREVDWRTVGAIAHRHRSLTVDMIVLAAVCAAALVFNFEEDVFVFDADQRSGAHAVQLDELLTVALLFCAGMALIVWRRLAEAKRESRRRRTAENEARSQALHDGLTGLPNRRAFDEALGEAAAAPPRTGASHAVLMLDLNGFKRVNDVFGHAVGDELLVHVGARLQAAVREGDLVARLGGDEFAVLAPHLAGAEAATGLALRLMQALEADVPAGGAQHRIGAAIGVALTPQDGDDPAELLRRADIALYRAKADKQLAPSAARFFEPEMDAHVRERHRLEAELRAAVDSGAVRTLFQPQVALSGGQITGFEALARWTSPTLGEVPAERFIAVAEDAGLISVLTDQLLDQACRAARSWPAPLTLAFNVSGALLHDRGFGLRVLATLGRTGLAPNRLELEITESALVRDLQAAREILGGLRQAGVRVALDDFGTGYSSLYHLRHFELDRIKIDKSFVAAMGEDGDSAAIVRALVGLGAGLGLEVVAEGVETPEQERMLREHGCGEAQGWLFSRPLEAADAQALVAGPAGAVYLTA